MRLTGSEIQKQIELKRIQIEPFDPEQLGPNSYDVRLAPTLYEVTQSIAYELNGSYKTLPLDLNKECSYYPIEIPKDGFVLEPNKFYLGVTKEFTSTDHYLPIIDGRSSCARYGLVIHQTAGFGDIGFAGHWTLELTVTLPLRVYPNIRIAQVSFEEVRGDIKSYGLKGHYKNEFSNNPKPQCARPGNFN